MKIQNKLPTTAILLLLLLFLAASAYLLLSPSSQMLPELKNKPLPELKIADHDYTRKEIDQKFRHLSIARRFAEEYRSNEATRAGKALNDYLIGKAVAEKGNSEELSECLKVVTPEGMRSLAIPCYAEKARFEGKSAWIIVQNWGMPGERLSRRRVWVIAPKSLQILYATSFK